MNDDPFAARTSDILLPAGNAASSFVPSGAPVATGESLDLSWSPPPGMVGLSVKNFLWRIPTLGIYNFWGKTEVRKRIWGAIRLNGEPLQYTGTGKELFLGFLFIMGVVTLPVFLISLGASLYLGQQAGALVQIAFSIAFFYLVGVGMHRAIRYRLSRTQWRGIRGGLGGSAWRYGWTYFWTGLMLIITLGWASPWRATKLQGLVVNGMRFGNQPFQFSASSSPLYGPFLALWLSGIAIFLGIVFIYSALASRAEPFLQRVFVPGRPPDPYALFVIVAAFYGVLIVGLILYGLVSAWYRAQLMNHFAGHTTFEGARFEGSATGRSLVALTITNLLMMVFTLGLLSPVVQARSARYFIQRLRIQGSAALDQVLQGAAVSGRGEGLAQAFDIDAF